MLKYINKAEALVSGWLKDMPHLPKAGTKWISENIWWITLVGVILSCIGLLFSLMGLLTALSTLGANPYYYGYGYSSVHSGFWIFEVLVSMAFTVVAAMLLSRAITPLKTMKAKGWNILFKLFLLDAIYVVVGALFSYGVIGFIFSLIFGAIGLAISAYLLFEIKSHFVKK